MAKIKLLIHGGAGERLKKNITAKEEQIYHAALNNALQAGYAILEQNGNSIEAVTAAVKSLEDSPQFNAGYGSVLTKAGTIECDAAIMDGLDLTAGCVASVSRLKNPIELANLILKQSHHILLVGKQAENFARAHGLKLINPHRLITPLQLQRWKKLQDKSKTAHSTAKKYGTVGAVALDKNGNIAAATSTGGIINKIPGRVGDSPIIGAGTYANNHTCAVSGTGEGEYYMRLLLAYDLAAQMEYKKIPLKTAGKNAIRRLNQLGGKGGLIALDRQGNTLMTFNTDTMFRGSIDTKKCFTAID